MVGSGDERAGPGCCRLVPNGTNRSLGHAVCRPIGDAREPHPPVHQPPATVWRRGSPPDSPPSPQTNPARSVTTPDRTVDLGEHDQRVTDQVVRGEAAPDVRRAGQSPLASQVGELAVAVAMVATVVLVDVVRARQQQVDPGEEGAFGVEQLHLGLDSDAGQQVEEPQRGLPRRRGPRVRERHGQPKSAYAGPRRRAELPAVCPRSCRRCAVPTRPAARDRASRGPEPRGAAPPRVRRPVDRGGGLGRRRARAARSSREQISPSRRGRLPVRSVAAKMGT